MQKITAELLGSGRILLDGKQVNLPFKQAEALVYYLLVEKETFRPKLADIIWGDSADEHKVQYFEEQLRLVYAQFEKALDKQVQLMNIEIRYPVTTLMRVLKRIKAPKKASYEAMDYFVAIHGDSPCTAYELFMQMSDVIFSAQCDGASGLRIAQLEEIVSRALNVNWHEYDHPGDFKW